MSGKRQNERDVHVFVLVLSSAFNLITLGTIRLSYIVNYFETVPQCCSTVASFKFTERFVITRYGTMFYVKQC